MSSEVRLPRPDGTRQTYRLSGSTPPKAGDQPITGRVAYAAAHVVGDPLVDPDQQGPPALDWEATLGFRRYLWSLGLGVAEAMDTAQRGAGLDWETSKQLIARSVGQARSTGGFIACGAGTDHLPLNEETTLDDVVAAYEQQVAFVEGFPDATVVLLASRALAAVATSVDHYLSVYSKILSQVARPVIIHWLGPMFDAALGGYWGFENPGDAVAVVVDLVAEHRQGVDGIKVSLLDEVLEVRLRGLLPRGIRLYTGDDFHYSPLILGDEHGHSDALLGIFDPIAPVAAAALRALDRGDVDAYERLLAPTVPLSRHMFRPPTSAYKTGVVFLAYLNDHQTHFRMVGGHESARSLVHLSRVFVLADRAGVLVDPERAVARLRPVLALGGVGP